MVYGLGIERSRGVLRDVYLVLIAAVGLFVFRQDEGYFIAAFSTLWYRIDCELV